MRVPKAQLKRQSRAAARLCQELQQEEELEAKKRLWIAKPWPCHPGAKDMELLDDKFTPEWPLNPKSENFIKNFVRRSFNDFLEEEEDGLAVLLQEISDVELAKALPFLLTLLNVRALQELFGVFSLGGSSRKVMNRMWLETRIGLKLQQMGFESGEALSPLLQQAVAIVRDRRSARKHQCAGFLSDLPSSPIAAATVALTHLDKLPLQSLRVMREVIFGKVPSEVCVSKAKYIGNKARYISQIKRRGSQLLHDVGEGGSLPVPLQKALVVMSLSARAMVGEDGNLRQCVDELYQGSESLQTHMLDAYSLVENLNLKQLEMAYFALTQQSREKAEVAHEYFDINSRSKKMSQRKHPNDYRQTVRRILFDHIIRIGQTYLPRHVRRVVAAMTAAPGGKQAQSRSKGRLLLRLKGQFDDEVRNIADLSCLLRDVTADKSEISSSPTSWLGDSDEIPEALMDEAGRDNLEQDWSTQPGTEFGDDMTWDFSGRCGHDSDSDTFSSFVAKEVTFPSLTKDSDDAAEKDEEVRHKHFNPVKNVGCPQIGGEFSDGAQIDTKNESQIENLDQVSLKKSSRRIDFSSPVASISLQDCSKVPGRRSVRPRSRTHRSRHSSSSADVFSSGSGSEAVESLPNPFEETFQSDSDDSCDRDHMTADETFSSAPETRSEILNPAETHRKASVKVSCSGNPFSENRCSKAQRERLRIADKAAVLMYVLIGQAMEGSRSSQGLAASTSAMKYLGGDCAANSVNMSMGTSTSELKPVDETERLFQIVEKLPAMSERAIEAVKQRISCV